MTHYRTVECSDRLPEKDDITANLSIAVPAAWEFPAEEGIQIISSFYDFMHHEWIINITRFHHPCRFAGYWLEPYEPPTEGKIDETIISVFKEYRTQSTFEPPYGFRKKLAKAITNLLKGEKK